MRVTKILAWPSLVIGLSVPCLMDCAAAKEASEAAQGCDELKGGATAVASLTIDAKLKAFVAATAELQTVATTIKADVKAACVGFATDLGVADTWSAMGETDDSISNAGMTGACDAVSVKINAILKANAMATATLTVSGGQCTVDADFQASCEGDCKVDVMCKEGDVTVRCAPGELTGQCSGTCSAMAVCEGSATVRAECQGSCEADCEGTCSGSCTGTVTGGCTGMCEGKCDGMATPAGGMANCAGMCEGKCSAPTAAVMCNGKCEASCKGKCSGNCKLDATAMVTCGANASCKGGCSVMYTAPKCEAELTPPTCMGDASCQASCKSSGELKATCTPPSAKFTIVGTADADLDKLKVSIEKNLPKIWLAAKTQGQLALKAGEKVVATGTAAASAAASFGGKAIACAGAAGTAAVTATASVNVSVKASANVSGSCSGGTT